MTVIAGRRQHNELRDRVAVARDRVSRLRAATTNNDVQGDVRRAAQEQLPQAEAELAGAQQELDQQVSRFAGIVAGRNGNSAGGVEFDSGGILSEQLNDPHFVESMHRLASSSSRFDGVQIGEISRDDVMRWSGSALRATDPVTLPPMMDVIPSERVIRQLVPPTRFLDLVPSGTLDQAVLPYAREQQTTGAGPGPVQPGALKPETQFEFVDASAAPVTIASWTKVRRQQLSDVAQLQGLITGRILQKIRTAIETEVVSGDGSVSDVAGVAGIVGLLDSSLSIATPDISHDVNNVDALLTGITSILVEGASPNVIAMNPLDRAALLKTKSAGGSEEYIASPFLSAASQCWDTPLVPAVGIPQGKVIIGDTSIGLQLLVREGATILLSNSDQDDLVRNRVTVLIECRVGLAVWVPAAFCILDLGDTEHLVRTPAPKAAKS